ncbi:MAG: DUF4345 domain-containing protein [Gemmataceae bacterium]|nr:DUF4345 domain-containing protein [Gemmataceae bacterium]
MNLPRAILGLTAIAFVGFGVAFTLWPAPMAGMTDLDLSSATARVDFAATYGGFELGFGAFLLLCLRRPAWVEAGLWAGLLALAGFAAVRTLTLLGSGAPVRAVIFVALALELSGVLLNGWGLGRLRRSRGSAA